MKQTAVEFVFDAVYRDMPYPELLGILAEARIMEKQQIIDARLTVPSELITYSKTTYLDEAEQYYKETFNLSQQDKP